MGYTVAYFFLVLLMIITDSNELSVNISPDPVKVIAGNDLVISSAITKTASESWKSFIFFVGLPGKDYKTCNGAFYIMGSSCSNVGACFYGFGFNCNNTHFNLLIDNVTTRWLGLSIYAEVSYGTNSKKYSNITTVQVKIPLQGVSLIPNGTITKTASENQIFRCFARSLPISNLNWQLDGFLLTPPAPPEVTIDTTTSHYTYIADKDDNGKTLSCTAVYNSTSFTERALINVLYRPIVTVSPDYDPYLVLENTTNLVLTCNATNANPTATSFEWRNSIIIISTEATFTISTVNRSHSGRYTCSASNAVGISTPLAATQLTVLYGADINTISKKEPTEGTELRITCSGQSYPVMTDNDVIWTKQNNNKFTRKGKQLVIGNINRTDSGTYVCSVVIKLTPSIGQPLDVSGRTTVEVDVFYRPVVTISPNHTQYNVIENITNLKLECKVLNANPSVSEYSWYKDSSILGHKGATYTISTVRPSDTGNYTCNAKNTVGSSDRSSALQLNVLYGVDFNPLEKKEPKELTRLVVSCSVKSNPEVTTNDVTWTKQNNVTFMRNGKNLVIDNVHRIDSGTYVCTVVIKLTPTIGQAVDVAGTTTVEVNVLYRPTVTVSPDYNPYNVIENTTNVQLTCTVIDTNPAVSSYRWYKGSSVISNAATYTLSSVDRVHSGNYTCDARNIVNTSNPSSSVTLNVLYGVRLNDMSKNIQTEGDQLIITCSGKSFPVMTSNDVKWSKQNNNTFSRVGKQLVIDNVNRLDSGIYVCFVVLQLTPTVGQPVNVSGTASVEVDVEYRPDVTVSPDKNPYHVTENTTNLHLTCNVIDANPALTSYRWYKDGIKVSTAAIYTITTVNRSNSGSYKCDATNTVGSSNPSSVVHLDVLYGVSLILSGAEFSVNESERWDLSCIVDGNPLPNITCVYGYNRTTVSEQKANVTSISVDHANCVDTGFYMCSGNNTIGDPVSRSADVKVACKPRTYNNVEKEEVLISGTDENLNISTTFVSFPLSQISWSRELPDGNLTDLENDFLNFTIQSHLPYETISILQKIKLTQDDFGIYLVNASNIHGSFVLKYHVIAKRAPDPPTNITASCDVISIRVTWISRFNGGENQLFRINLVNNKSNKTISKEGIADKERNSIIIEEIESLSSDTLYLISLEAKNSYGATNSTESANCTTLNNEEDAQLVSSALIGGTTGSISALLIVVIVIGGIHMRRRRQVPGVHKELIQSGSKETDEDEESLKENPLYVTSGETSNAEVGPVYGVVNKKTQNKQNISFDENNDQGAVYSQVQKSNIHGIKKQKEKKAKKDPKKADICKDIELGTVYENSDKLFKYKHSDELYANAGEQGNGDNSSKVYSPKKNKDGLIYADLDLIPGPSGNKFVIRGLENKTNYAILDLSIKVDPLPSDDEDEDTDDGKKKSPDNKSNE